MCRRLACRSDSESSKRQMTGPGHIMFGRNICLLSKPVNIIDARVRLLHVLILRSFFSLQFIVRLLNAQHLLQECLPPSRHIHGNNLAISLPASFYWYLNNIGPPVFSHFPSCYEYAGQRPFHRTLNVEQRPWAHVLCTTSTILIHGMFGAKLLLLASGDAVSRGLGADSVGAPLMDSVHHVFQDMFGADFACFAACNAKTRALGAFSVGFPWAHLLQLTFTMPSIACLAPKKRVSRCRRFGLLLSSVGAPLAFDVHHAFHGMFGA